MKQFNLTIIQKISFAGAFIVLASIFQKAFAITIPFMPFARISFGGPATIIVASILLGPWFGLLVGAASDLLGFLIFDPKTMSPYPMYQITLIYAALGFGAYYIFKLISKIKNNRSILIVEGSLMGALWLAITLFVELMPSITLYGKTYNFDLTIKIVVPIIIFILLIILLLFSYFVGKRFEKRLSKVNITQVSFASFITEIIFMVVIGCSLKMWAFSVYQVTPFFSMIIVQLIIGFFNIPVNTILVSYILELFDKIILRRK